MDGNLLKLVTIKNAPFGEIWVDPTTRVTTLIVEAPAGSHPVNASVSGDPFTAQALNDRSR
jgi:hypothetical protein